MLATFLPLLTLLPLISGRVIDVVVGGPGKLFYTPQYVNGQPGDTVRFNFQVKNHTVTQSSFDHPCTRIEHGFDSGFKPVPDTQTSQFSTFEVTVGSMAEFTPLLPIEKPGMDSLPANRSLLSGNGLCDQPSVPRPNFCGIQGESDRDCTYSPLRDPASKSSSHRDAGNVYTPNNIKAKVGDTITFEFRQKNHTLTQSSFSDPCRKLEFTSPIGEVGFDTGFKPVPADQASHFPTYTLTVKDSKPIWAYCRQTTHCGQGMVFAVNAPTSGDNTFDNFRANAIRINGTTTSV